MYLSQIYTDAAFPASWHYQCCDGHKETTEVSFYVHKTNEPIKKTEATTVIIILVIMRGRPGETGGLGQLLLANAADDKLKSTFIRGIFY